MNSITSVNLRQVACEVNGGHTPRHPVSSYEYMCARCHTTFGVPRLYRLWAEYNKAVEQGEDAHAGNIRREMTKMWDSYNAQYQRVYDTRWR